MPIRDLFKFLRGFLCIVLQLQFLLLCTWSSLCCVRLICFLRPVEDGDALDPCILSTLRKLQDGYFAGARSVCTCNTLSLLRFCFWISSVNVSTGCRCQTFPVSRPLHSTLASASWMKRMTTAYLRMKRRMAIMRNIAPVGPQVGSEEQSERAPLSHICFFIHKINFKSLCFQFQTAQKTCLTGTSPSFSTAPPPSPIFLPSRGDIIMSSALNTPLETSCLLWPRSRAWTCPVSITDCHKKCI